MKGFVLVEADATPDEVEVGSVLPLLLTLTHLGTDLSCLRLDRFRIDPKSPFRLEEKALQNTVEIGQGETYRLCIPVVPQVPGLFHLNNIHISCSAGEFDLPARIIRVSPAFPAGVSLRIESCQGATPRVHLQHTGHSVLPRIRLTLSPVRVGPLVIQRAPFSPGDHLDLAVLSDHDQLTATIEVQTDHGTARQVRHLALSSADSSPDPVRPAPFQFLNPEGFQFGAELRILREYSNSGNAELRPDHEGRYWLESGRRYRVAIKPRCKTHGVVMNPVPQRVFLRKPATLSDDGWWHCPIEVAGKQTLRHRDVLHFQMQGEHGKRDGQIQIGITPAFATQGLVALSLGGALMAQGVIGIWPTLGKWFAGATPEWQEVLAGFTARGDWNLMRLFAVPFCLAGLWFFDWVRELFGE